MSVALKVNRYRDKLHALRAHLDAHVSQLVEDFPDPADSADRANQQTEVATKTNMSERIRRLRSSSRCSRKDICPPSSSSFDRPEASAFRNVDINDRYRGVTTL